MNNRTDITSLRDALAVLKSMPDQLVETDVPVRAHAQLAGVYRYVGAGGTVKRPTRVDGPAMLFGQVEGFEDASVLIGLLADRKSTRLNSSHR